MQGFGASEKPYRRTTLEVEPPVTAQVSPDWSKTPRVVGLVRFGGQPAVMPDSVMEALWQREDAKSGLHQGKCQILRPGELISLVDGPLLGMEGVFARLDGDRRVMVLLEFLGHANKVSVSRDWIKMAA